MSFETHTQEPTLEERYSELSAEDQTKVYNNAQEISDYNGLSIDEAIEIALDNLVDGKLIK